MKYAMTGGSLHVCGKEKIFFQRSHNLNLKMIAMRGTASFLSCRLKLSQRRCDSRGVSGRDDKKMLQMVKSLTVAGASARRLGEKKQKIFVQMQKLYLK
jgi:hypothetical protein